MAETTIEKYKFKKGEKYHLDDIYTFQGIGGNDWWKIQEVPEGEYINVDNIVIIKPIEFIIKIKRG